MKSNCPITVESLRRDGYKVRVNHKRDYFKEEINPYTGDISIVYRRMSDIEAKNSAPDAQLDSFGGETVVEITTPDNRNLRGVASCNPNDQFNRKLALRIALGRALKGNK